MMEPPWKRLLVELRSSDYKSPHLERLRARFPSPGASLAHDLLQEMASALGRSEAKVEAALVRLDLQARSIEALLAAEQRGGEWRIELNHAIAAFNREREVALHSRWELLVHREALGFRQNEDLPSLYPVPVRRDPIV